MYNIYVPYIMRTWKKVGRGKKTGSQTDRKRIKTDNKMSDRQILGQTDRENLYRQVVCQTVRERPWT
jgi:hypothetical protein